MRNAPLDVRERSPRSPSDPWRFSRGPRRRRLSESVAKAPIAPRRTKRIVDIPRFFSPSIPARSAFATDSDMTPPHAPHINAQERQLTRENVCWSHVLAGYPAISSTRTSTPRSPEQPRRPRIELDRPIERQSRHFAIQPRSSPAPKDALPAPGLRLRPPVRGRGRHVTAPPRPRGRGRRRVRGRRARRRLGRPPRLPRWNRPRAWPGAGPPRPARPHRG